MAVAQSIPRLFILIYPFYTLIIAENALNMLIVFVCWLIIGLYAYKKSFPFIS